MTMFILGVGTSPGGRAWAGKSNTMNAGVGGGRPLTSPAPGSVGRRSTISYDQAKTSSSSTERTNDAPRYSDIQLFLSSYISIHRLSFTFNLKDKGESLWCTQATKFSAYSSLAWTLDSCDRLE